MTAQLRDVAQAFCLEVWGQALTIVEVSTKSELRAPNRVYYPPALRLAPSLPKSLADPSFASVSVQPTITPTTIPATEKGQDQSPPVAIVDVESEEVAEVG